MEKRQNEDGGKYTEDDVSFQDEDAMSVLLEKLEEEEEETTHPEENEEKGHEKDDSNELDSSLPSVASPDSTPKRSPVATAPVPSQHNAPKEARLAFKSGGYDTSPTRADPWSPSKSSNVTVVVAPRTRPSHRRTHGFSTRSVPAAPKSFSVKVVVVFPTKKKRTHASTVGPPKPVVPSPTPEASPSASSPLSKGSQLAKLKSQPSVVSSNPQDIPGFPNEQQKQDGVSIVAPANRPSPFSPLSFPRETPASVDANLAVELPLKKEKDASTVGPPKVDVPAPSPEATPPASSIEPSSEASKPSRFAEQKSEKSEPAFSKPQDLPKLPNEENKQVAEKEGLGSGGISKAASECADDVIASSAEKDAPQRNASIGSEGFTMSSKQSSISPESILISTSPTSSETAKSESISTGISSSFTPNNCVCGIPMGYKENGCSYLISDCVEEERKHNERMDKLIENGQKIADFDDGWSMQPSLPSRCNSLCPMAKLSSQKISPKPRWPQTSPKTLTFVSMEIAKREYSDDGWGDTSPPKADKSTTAPQNSISNGSEGLDSKPVELIPAMSTPVSSPPPEVIKGSIESDEKPKTQPSIAPSKLQYLPRFPNEDKKEVVEKEEEFGNVGIPNVPSNSADNVMAPSMKKEAPQGNDIFVQSVLRFGIPQYSIDDWSNLAMRMREAKIQYSCFERYRHRRPSFLPPEVCWDVYEAPSAIVVTPLSIVDEFLDCVEELESLNSPVFSWKYRIAPKIPPKQVAVKEEGLRLDGISKVVTKPADDVIALSEKKSPQAISPKSRWPKPPSKTAPAVPLKISAEKREYSDDGWGDPLLSKSDNPVEVAREEENEIKKAEEKEQKAVKVYERVAKPKSQPASAPSKPQNLPRIPIEDVKPVAEKEEGFGSARISNVVSNSADHVVALSAKGETPQTPPPPMDPQPTSKPDDRVVHVPSDFPTGPPIDAFFADLEKKGITVVRRTPAIVVAHDFPNTSTTGSGGFSSSWKSSLIAQETIPGSTSPTASKNAKSETPVGENEYSDDGWGTPSSDKEKETKMKEKEKKMTRKIVDKEQKSASNGSPGFRYSITPVVNSSTSEAPTPNFKCKIAPEPRWPQTDPKTSPIAPSKLAPEPRSSQREPKTLPIPALKSHSTGTLGISSLPTICVCGAPIGFPWDMGENCCYYLLTNFAEEERRHKERMRKLTEKDKKGASNGSPSSTTPVVNSSTHVANSPEACWPQTKPKTSLIAPSKMSTEREYSDDGWGNTPLPKTTNSISAPQKKSSRSDKVSAVSGPISSTSTVSLVVFRGLSSQANSVYAPSKVTVLPRMKAPKTETFFSSKAVPSEHPPPRWPQPTSMNPSVAVSSRISSQPLPRWPKKSPPTTRAVSPPRIAAIEREYSDDGWGNTPLPKTTNYISASQKIAAEGRAYSDDGWGDPSPPERANPIGVAEEEENGVKKAQQREQKMVDGPTERDEKPKSPAIASSKPQELLRFPKEEVEMTPSVATSKVTVPRESSVDGWGMPTATNSTIAFFPPKVGASDDGWSVQLALPSSRSSVCLESPPTVLAASLKITADYLDDGWGNTPLLRATQSISTPQIGQSGLGRPSEGWDTAWTPFFNQAPIKTRPVEFVLPNRRFPIAPPPPSPIPEALPTATTASVVVEGLPSSTSARNSRRAPVIPTEVVGEIPDLDHGEFHRSLMRNEAMRTLVQARYPELYDSIVNNITDVVVGALNI